MGAGLVHTPSSIPSPPLTRTETSEVLRMQAEPRASRRAVLAAALLQLPLQQLGATEDLQAAQQAAGAQGTEDFIVPACKT